MNISDISSLSKRCRMFREESKMAKSELLLHETIDACEAQLLPSINPRNYSLCEAAPDLLEALIKCNQVLGKSETYCDQTTGLPISPLLIEVRTAIAKANGLL